MLRILGRGRSVPTVTELIFVRAQCLTILLLKHFALCGTITGSAIKAFCTLRNNDWIQLLLRKSAKCFNSKMVKHCALTWSQG
jgi:hypothetical protein